MKCSVDGCENNVKQYKLKGLCNLHYLRLRRHGSPTAGGTYRGSTEKFLRDLIGTEVRECITWPFSRDVIGQARMRWNGKNVSAHRVMCEMVNGPPPGPKYQSTHKCGKGYEGCVNPNHLEWGTGFKNQQDRVDHGTDNRGEKCGTHKLTEEEAMTIFNRLNSGERQADLAREYDVHFVTIHDIKIGRSWAWLTGLPNPREHDKYGNLVHANDNAASTQVGAA